MALPPARCLKPKVGEHTCSLRPARRQQDQSGGARHLPVHGCGVSNRLHTTGVTLTKVDHTETAADCPRGWEQKTAAYIL